MYLLQRFRILILFFLLLGIGGIAIWADEYNALKPSTDSCGIYMAYHSSLETGIPHVFRPNSMARLIESPDYIEYLPSSFLMDSGKRELVETEFASEPYERIIYQDFEFDTASVFEGSNLSSVERIKGCFRKAKNGPSFSKLPINMILLKKFGAKPNITEDGFISAFNIDFLTVHEVSPPLISADNTHGLIFTESSCGPLCGHGAYFLFENEDGEWRQIGFHTRWVS